MKKIYYTICALLAIVLHCGCTGDLDQKPVIGDNATAVYSTIDGYKAVLAKIYGSYSLVGQERAGNVDLSSNKGQDLLRNLFNMQEAATDEVANTWLSGENLAALTYMNWDASDVWVADTYYRLYYSIALCNEFLRYTTEGAIASFSENEKSLIRTYAAEARFIRALDYWFVLDLFRQGPYVDQDTPTTGVIPPAYNGQQLYDFLMSEISELETLLPETNGYAQADRASLWALAVRLTLNAEIYTGSPAYDDCVAFATKIIRTGRYTLENDYRKLFNADNHLRTNEIIFAFAADADQATTWGSATNIICSSCGNNSSQDPAKYGIEAGWGNWRVRGELPALFDAADLRRLFWEDGQSQYFTDGITTDTQGFFSEKWTNLTDAGEAASPSAARGCSTDYPMFRLAEVYLSAAEAVLRGGSGMSRNEALELVNEVRKRAFGDDSGKISDAQFNLLFLLDERGRELYHEMHRRTDLVRFGRFTTDTYLWQWKGGVLDGAAVNARYNIYPLPLSELSANSNLSNPLY
ncbi:MAG: RagB/SusD family nutrient uptake outer membrane protein [Muribaculaceae bacterium]|nr:RagB/SusD family nutrient uptake outer membrane protein [Muribaculaceae bacterium]